MLLDFLQDVGKWGGGWRGIFIRKSYPELEQAISDSFKIFPQTGATYEKQPKTWHWPGGETLRFRNLEKEEDAGHYQGHSYSWFGLDEAGNYASPSVYFMMLATVRSGDYAIPTARVRVSANPGGPGHHWLKTRFIDPAPLGYRPIREPGEKRERMFIPARITDNKLLLKNDPGYIENLKKQASPELVKAWLYGDWDIQISSFFPEFSVAKHVCKSVSLPDHWYRFRTFDWGGARPFAVLWWAVSDGEPFAAINGQLYRFPRGALVCYREWYGMEKGRPDVGIRMRNEDIAAGIIQRTADNEKIQWTSTDSLPFQYRGGPKIAETFALCGVDMRQGDTSRIPGWSQLRARLIGNAEGPLIYFQDSCIHTIRTLPALQAHKHKPEDVGESQEDHAPDAVRLACMDRPIVKDEPKPAQGLKPLSEMTFAELLKYDELHADE